MMERRSFLAVLGALIAPERCDSPREAAFKAPDLSSPDHAPFDPCCGNLSVKSAPFNAKGDGIADDTHAFAAAKAVSNTIHVPPGVFRISRFDGSNVSLVGSGRGVTTIQGDGDLVVNATRFNLERVTIRNTKTRGKLVSLGGGPNIERSRFADVEFGMAASHVYVDRVCVDWLFESCRFNDASNVSRHLKAAWALKEIGCYSWYNSVGLRITGGTTISSVGCVYEYNTRQAVILSAEAGGTINNVLFQGTHFESNGTRGGTESVRLETLAAERIRNVSFTSCTFLALKGAQHVYATAGGGGNIARISFRDVFASDKLINAGFAPVFDNVEMNTGVPPGDALAVESLLSRTR